MGLSIQSDILVVGGGAAGLMAACGAASADNHPLVTLLEKMPRPGRKIMITGKGRCNFTNLKDWNAFSGHIRTDSRFLRPAFYNFTPEDAIAFFESEGVETVVERGDRVFPASYKASDIVDALSRRAISLGVMLMADSGVKRIETSPEGFVVICSGGKRYEAQKLIIATGGLSYPRTGSSGDGYAWAEQLGHHLRPRFPSLTAIVPRGYKDLEAGPSVGRIAAKVLGGMDETEICQESALPPGYPSPTGHIPRETPLSEWGMKLCGLSLDNITLTLGQGKDILQQETGDISFTDGGLEGPLGFSVSRNCVKCIQNGGKPWVKIDLKPGIEAEALLGRIKRLWDEIQGDPRSRGQNIRQLSKILLGKLLPWEAVDGFIQGNPGIFGNNKISLPALVEALKGWRMDIAGFVGYERCVVTAGGVDTSEILPKTLESRLVKGLYFCGEILDIDADTGGYNLHLAFSTGLLAGQSAAKAILK